MKIFDHKSAFVNWSQLPPEQRATTLMLICRFQMHPAFSPISMHWSVWWITDFESANHKYSILISNSVNWNC